MSQTVKCGHCDGKGVCERGGGRWSCSTCTGAAGYIFNRGLSGENPKAVKCSICDGTGWVKVKDDD
jgi:hypothetical protein